MSFLPYTGDAQIIAYYQQASYNIFHCAKVGWGEVVSSVKMAESWPVQYPQVNLSIVN